MLATILWIAVFAVFSTAQTCEEVIAGRYPRQYVAYRANHPPVMDGRLDEPFWEQVPFTSTFVDISTNVTPHLTTRAKVRWNDEWLYVAGELHEPAVWANITHTCHCFNPQENQVIFYDNDFEVFVDADGTCQFYKEYEMNAANANWDLCLNRPYENGGYENSTRVYGVHGFDMTPPLYSAASSDGMLNDPASRPTKWTVEIAFPLQKLIYNTTATLPLKNKQFWRINFSRVEWAVQVIDNRYFKYPSCQSCPVPGSNAEDNWVWSPMHAIDMHHPEMWGFLQFSTDAPNSSSPIYNVEWPPRFVAHELYYAEQAYATAHDGKFTDNITALVPFATFPVVFNGHCTASTVPHLETSAAQSQFLATIAGVNFNVTINNDRFIRVHYA